MTKTVKAIRKVFGITGMTKSTKAKISASQKGRRWVNNGVEELRVYELPEGFVYGRLKKVPLTEEQILEKIFKLRNVQKVVPAVETMQEAA